MNHHPHDRLVRWAFSRAETAASILQSALPVPLSRVIDWSSLALREGSFVDPALAGLHTDLLFEARARTGAEDPLLLYVLFEHQSQPDPLMAFRVARYALRVQERWLGEARRAGRLPWVIPVVLYHGQAPWTAPRDLVELLMLPDLPRAELPLPSFPYRLLDLSSTRESDLRLDALGILVTRLLRHAWDEDLWDRLPEWGPVLKQVLLRHGLGALESAFRYIADVCEQRPGSELRRWITTTLGSETEEAMSSWAQQEREQGRQEGRQEGRQDVILGFLRRRFGAITPELEQRVRRTEPDALDRWLDLALQAKSLDELMAT